MKCKCGCGKEVPDGNKWIKGHHSRFSKEKREEMIDRYESGESATSIANEMDLHTTSVTRVLKRNGFKVGYKKGKEHPMWEGGKTLKTGYPCIWEPNHPRSMKTGYVKEHILVLECYLERKIKEDEVVHHINFDRTDNNIDNLWVTDNSNHIKAEKSIYKLVKSLLEKNIIRFNREKEIYEMVEKDD